MAMITPPPQGSLPADVGTLPELAEPDGAGALTAVEAEELGLAPAVKPRGLLRRGW